MGSPVGLTVVPGSSVDSVVGGVLVGLAPCLEVDFTELATWNNIVLLAVKVHIGLNKWELGN